MDFKKDRYIDVLTYIIAKTSDKGNVGKTVLSNMLYFIDFNYYELYGESLTGESYFKTLNGLSPAHFNSTLIDLIQSDIIYLKKEPYFDNYIKKYYITRIPNHKFSKKEYFVIKDVLDSFADYSATRFNYYLSKDAPFRNAGIDEEITYECVFHRDSEYSVKSSDF